MTIGIPGAGKTTWVKKYIGENKRTNMHVISTDEIREELTGDPQCDPKDNVRIHGEAIRRAKDIIDNPDNYGGNMGLGPTIIIDSTNTDVNLWRKYRELNPTLMMCKIFLVDVDEGMKRQEGRERKVPRFVLEDKNKELLANLHLIPTFFDIYLD